MEKDFSANQWLEALSLNLQKTQCRVVGELCAMDSAFYRLKQLLIQVRNENKSVWWVGNGGSSALCSHLSQDLLNKLKIRSQTLSDTSLLTCMANDFGYENIYLRPLETLMNDNDMVIAVSSSGKSKNILNVANLAISKNAKLVTLSAFTEDNPLWKVRADVSFFLPCKLYGHAEVGHEAILHSAIETLWQEENES